MEMQISFEFCLSFFLHLFHLKIIKKNEGGQRVYPPYAFLIDYSS